VKQKVGTEAKAEAAVPTHVPIRPARHAAVRAVAGARHPRLAGIDAARGLALVGMIVVNVGPVGSQSLLQRLYLLPYGRASVLFVVVAGIGMGYLLNRRPERERWSTVTWRAALLFGGGAALQELTEQVNVILPTYAVLFLLAPLLWRLPDRTLLGIGVVLALAGPAVIVAHETIWPGPQAVDPVTLGTPPWEAAYSLLLTGRYPLLSVARLDLTDTAVLRRLAAGGAAVAAVAVAVAQLAYLLIGPDADRGPWRLLTGAAHGQMPLWLASSIGGAVAVVAACVLLLRRFERSRVLGWLVACGRLSLTLYVLHFVVLAVIKPAQGFSFGQGVLISSALVVAVIVAAVLWARTGRPGPIEQLLRRSWLLPPTTRVRSTTQTYRTEERATQQ
jgi:uncharacterized membrane protein YeiB